MSKLKNLYEELLKDITVKSKSFIEERISVFNYAKGSEYDNLILFVGRSVNGWNNYSKNELIQNQTEILNNIGSDDLQWTIDQWGETDIYNTKKSAFWRLNRKLSDSFYGENDENFNKVSWTNLYKVSKADKGNPSEGLCNSQFDLVKQILIEEVKLLKPKYVVFHTALNWAKPFLMDDKNITIELLKGNKYVEAKGTFYGSKIVVGQHPQSKPEDEQLKEILQHLI